MRYLILGNTGLDEAEHEEYHAYFVWHDGGDECSEVYSIADLEAEIDSRKQMGQPTALYEAALKRLCIINGLR